MLKNADFEALILFKCSHLQCVTAVDGYWLAELGPMFYSVKETAKSRGENKKDAVEWSKAMEREMKEAEAELRRRKAQEAEDKDRERDMAGAIATPGRFEKGTPRRKTPFRVGL